MKGLKFTLLIAILQALTVTCRDVETYGWKETTGDCTAQSYTPGGKTEIQTTTAPTATLQKTAFQAFFTHVNTGRTEGIIGISSDVIGQYTWIYRYSRTFYKRTL